MADEEKLDIMAQRGTEHRKSRRPYLFGMLIVLALAAAAWFMQSDEETKDAPAVTTFPRTTEPSPAAEERRGLPSGVPNKPEPVHSPTETITAGEEAFAPVAGEIAEASSAEKELHWQKTQMFVAEAKQSLPLIGIRPFDARRATVASSDIPGTGMTDGEISGIPGRDGRGLRDGEVWIRIDPARSGEYKEVMAQTADLYRANTGFEGEVTVLLWVGGRVHARETFGLAW